jgi:hypothetical protein
MGEQRAAGQVTKLDLYDGAHGHTHFDLVYLTANGTVCKASGPASYSPGDHRYLRAALASFRLADGELETCDFCGQTEGHSPRCSVTKDGVNPKPPYEGGDNATT